MGTLDISVLQNKTPAELDKMTKVDLIAAIVGDQNKTECTKSVDCPGGQALREFVTKNAAGAVVQTERWGWTYNKDGSVFEISYVVLDTRSVVIGSGKIVHAAGKVSLVKMDAKEIGTLAVEVLK